MKKPFISVVMSTYNRAELLRKQLQAFKNQTLPKEEFEIIIVNDGSSDITLDVLNKCFNEVKNLRFFTKENGGPASARNHGVHFSLGEVIAFTDDDCIVDEDWVERIYNRFKDKAVQVVEGQTYTSRKLRTPLTHQIENLRWNSVVPTCNAAYRKSFFIELGGFNEHFPFPHNEDTDLAWRALEKTEVIFDESVKVYHPPIKVPFISQMKRMKMLSSEFVLYKKNKVGYKKWRASHPWVTIYKEVFLKHQLLNLKFHLGFYRRPKLLMEGIVLSAAWWIYLVVLFPKFVNQSFKQEGY